jgi:hypothetical protein
MTCGYGGYAPPPPNPYAGGPPWIDPIDQFCVQPPNPWAPMPTYFGWQRTPINFIRD